MSERERWIVYPLLFFALGAAVRDKILHRIDAKEIYCESLKIVDQQDPRGRTLAELGIQRARPNDPTQLADRIGMLRLVDSDGNIACQVTHDAVFERLVGNQLLIIDDKQRPLVVAGVEQAPGMIMPNGEQTVTSQGVIYLNNQKLGIKIAPPVNRQPAEKVRPGASL
jgi:hypothetical protein